VRSIPAYGNAIGIEGILIESAKGAFQQRHDHYLDKYLPNMVKPKIMDKTSFHEASVELLREAFEGRKTGADGTWFVEKSEAILPSLKQITAEQASKQAHPNLASIGAHVNHLIYALTWGNTCHGGNRPEGTWNDTWKQNAFAPKEWDRMRNEVTERYLSYLAWFSANTDWSHEEGVIAPLALLPHVAYHLGAIRQLMAF